MRRNEHQKLN